MKIGWRHFSEERDEYHLEVTGTYVEMRALRGVVKEYISAASKFGPFNSAHEGYAVILEETDELWDEVKLKDRSLSKILDEARQVSAMGLRMIIDMRNKYQENKVVNEESIFKDIQDRLDRENLAGALGLAAGYLSMCWDGPGATGVFQSEKAGKMVDFLEKGIRDMFQASRLKDTPKQFSETEHARQRHAGVDAHSRQSGLHDPKGGAQQ